MSKSRSLLNWQTQLSAIVLSAMLTSSAFATDQRYLTYSGRILNASSQPVTGNVSFHIQVTDTSGACIVWDETFASVPVASGVFTLQIGSGTVNFNGGSGMLDGVFQSGTSLNCKAGGTTTPASTDDRNLVVTFNDGSGSGNQTLANQLPIKSVPFAMNAENTLKLAGTPVSLTPPTSGQILQFDGTNWAPAPAATSSGSVSSMSVVSANGFSGTVANASTTPAVTLSTTISGLLKGNGTALSAATAGTDYSTGTSSLGTGILKSTTGTGALSIATALDFPVLNQNTTGTAANVSGIVTAAHGGTGLDTSTASNGQLLIGNGSGLSLATLTQGAGITITNSSGGIQFDVTGTAGNAGGDLTGTYPNPSLAAILGSSGTVGNTGVPVISYDTKGRITAASSVAYANATTVTAGIVTVGSNLSVSSGTLSLTNSNVTGALGYTPLDIAGSNKMTGTLGLAQLAADPSTAGWNGTQKGSTWFNTTSNQVKYWDGSSIQALGVSGSGSGITSLTGDVTTTGSGAAAATVAAVGGSTAANVHTAEQAVNVSATSASTASVLVKRDSGGASNFKTVNLDGATSGILSLSVPSTVTSYTLKFPAAGTTADQVLGAADGSGNLTWLNLGNIAGSINLSAQVSNTLQVTNGGTGATSPTTARAALGAAASGANSDITSLTGLTTPLAISEGGTGAASVSAGLVFAGPSIGVATAPSFRTLASTDLPSGTVSSSASGTSGYYAKFSGASAIQNAGLFESAGSVGLGTTTPTQGKLVSVATVGAYSANFTAMTPGVAQGEKPAISLYSTFQGTGDNGPRRTADIIAGFNGGSWSYEFLSFNVGGSSDGGAVTTEKMRIQGNGNIGIGTTSPSTTLDIAGQNLLVEGVTTTPGEFRLGPGPTTGTNFVGFRGPSSNPTTSVLWQLPASDGTSGQMLTTNGGGQLSWTTPGVTLNQLHYQVFNSSGTFTTPAGTTTSTVYKITVVGGGGPSPYSAGAGGAGAGAAIYVGSGVSAGSNLPITVGTGGTFDQYYGTVTAGGTSSIVFAGTTISATGGGVSSSSGNPVPGTGTNGTLNLSGTLGEPTIWEGGGCSPSYAIGGSGGASIFAGGPGSGGGSPSTTATAPANGVVIIEWNQ